jgi:lysophospholipase L1-like esterase
MLPFNDQINAIRRKIADIAIARLNGQSYALPVWSVDYPSIPADLVDTLLASFNVPSMAALEAELAASQDAAVIDSVAASAAYGTSFVGGDVVLLGDSLSTAVGYDMNGDPVGNFSEAIGGQISNFSRGGMTTREALTGIKPEAIAQLDEPSPLVGYGDTYAGLLRALHPEKIILRYGAADAALLKSPAETLDNLRKMIDMAIVQNVEPILVTITPVAKSGEIVHGGLYGDYFDFMPPLVTRINSGIRQLASEYQLNLIDVSTIALPAGGLLDGLHPNAQAGALIADQIEQQLAAQMTPVAPVIDQTRQLVAPEVITAPAAPSDAQPVVTQPAITQPAITQPAITQPAITQPAITQPAITQPAITQPVVTAPAAGGGAAILLALASAYFLGA